MTGAASEKCRNSRGYEQMITVTNKKGSTTLAGFDVQPQLKASIPLSKLEAALGRRLKHEDVIEATLNGATFRGTVHLRGYGTVGANDGDNLSIIND
jgi:hypothetical protein